MLKYTSKGRSISIFQDNKDLGDVPYIKLYFILDFTTACHQTINDMAG